MVVGKTRHLPRFKRCSNCAAHLKLTARDIEIVRSVHNHRLLRSSQISQIIAGSHQQLLRRLRLLFHHGYVDRPLAQLNSLLTGGSQAMSYALGNKDLRLLESSGDVLPRSGNFRLGHTYIEGTSEISRFMVSLEKSAAELSELTSINEDALGREFQMADPFRWNVQLRDWRVSVRPDSVFALEAAETSSFVLSFMEVDRGTKQVRARVRPVISRRNLFAYNLA